MTHTLAGEYVGLEEVDDGLWDEYFGPIKLGRMDERKLRIEDHKGRWVRKTVLAISPTVQPRSPPAMKKNRTKGLLSEAAPERIGLPGILIDGRKALSELNLTSAISCGA